MMVSFFETIWFAPKWYHWLVAILLLPISILWGIIAYFRRSFITPQDLQIPIISLGNLIVGGSGKTPFLISLAKELNAKNIHIVSRGYGRVSSGLIEVSHKGKILTTVEKSGDEAMLIASSLPSASVIVSENRTNGIIRAKELGADIILLDDGHNQISIKKLDIILEPNHIKNYLPMPSGPFREYWFMSKKADLILKDEVDFKREVEFENLTKKMLLVTAIANPSRLDRYLPNGIIDRYFQKDHSYFDEVKIANKMSKIGANSILVTEKDFVKMSAFKLPISKIKLKLEINSDVISTVNRYIEGYK
jgi:tetraacyldisaccharide 4'-kinase